MKKINLTIINILLLFSIALLMYQTFLWKNELISVKNEIIKYENQTYNSDNLKELCYDVKRIENIQNERFSMLGWGLSVLFTFIGVILIIGFLNTKATITNLVHETLDDKHKEFSEKYKNIMLDIETKKELFDSEYAMFLKGLKDSAITPLSTKNCVTKLLDYLKFWKK